MIRRPGTGDNVKIRLVSDGTRAGTFVVDDATNEPIENIESIDWHYEQGGQAVGVIRLTQLGADLSGEIRRMTD